MDKADQQLPRTQSDLSAREMLLDDFVKSSKAYLSKLSNLADRAAATLSDPASSVGKIGGELTVNAATFSLKD